MQQPHQPLRSQRKKSEKSTVTARFETTELAGNFLLEPDGKFEPEKERFSLKQRKSNAVQWKYQHTKGNYQVFV